MKRLAILSLFTLNSSLFTLSAAVPLRWTVETSRATPAQFEAYQGETLALEAALQSYGKPLEAPASYSLYWQTNGMGNAWWSVPCTPQIRRFDDSHDSTISNVLFATWSPTNDVGEKVYNCFIGKPGTIYHAAFQLRLRPSPGALPNALPLPQKVIDFAKVTVLNPPWSGGGGGGVDTNAFIDIIREQLATNGIRSVDGEGRYLPPYLHYLEMDDTYPEEAAEWYAQADYSHGSCSSRRSGNLLERNYDWTFNFMPEFVVRVVGSRVPRDRFASLAVCNVGTNLTEADVVSGKWSKWYKALPGHAVDGINSEGVVAEVNVVSTNGVENWHGDPAADGIHCLGAIRWVLDHATNAQHGAEVLAERVYVPDGYGNFHYMIADSTSTWIVENGEAYPIAGATGVPPVAVMTNFRLYDTLHPGEGIERYSILTNGAPITNVWFTNAYRPTDYPWVSDLGSEYESIWELWASKPRESHRGETFNGQYWWQSVHTSIYDMTNRTLHVAVQEHDDWYTFAVPSAGGVKPEAVKKIVEPMIGDATNGLRRVDDMAVYDVVRTENTDWTWESPDDDYYLLNFLGGKKITFNGSEWGYPDLPTGYAEDITPSGSPDDLSVSFQIHRLSDDFYVDVTATRPRYMDETCAPSTNAAIAAVVTNGTGKVTEGGMVKLGANGRLVKATAGTDYADEATGTYKQVVRGRWNSEYGRWEIYVWEAEIAATTPWNGVLEPPTTLSGYGITDGATKAELAAKQDALPYPTNAIPASVITGLDPPSSPILRVYDVILHCWWIGTMVNGVINWEVE